MMKTGVLTTSIAMTVLGIALTVAAPVQAETTGKVSAARADNNSEGRMGGAQAAAARTASDSSHAWTAVNSKDGAAAAAAVSEAPRTENRIK